MSIKIIPYETLGRNQFGWLDARHHFSFGRYVDRSRMGFGSLRVINDDIIAARSGFDTHPHDNMEIITYVRSGAITHRDSAGNEGKTAAGDVQVMSAGSGIQHSEQNEEDEITTLYQIWIEPRERDVAPRWDAREFPKKAANDSLSLLVSGDKADEENGALFIHADAKIYGGRIKAGETLEHTLRGPGYVLLSEGMLSLNDTDMRRGDGAEITDISALTLNAQDDSEVLIIELAA